MPFFGTKTQAVNVLATARMRTLAAGTSIPTGTGYVTKWVMAEVEYDSLGANIIADLTNSQFLIAPARALGCNAYNFTLTMAWQGNVTGYRAARLKDNLGVNQGNQRFNAVNDATVTSNIFVTSGWKLLPNVITSFAVFPAQTSGGNLLAGADTASSWMQIQYAFIQDAVPIP